MGYLDVCGLEPLDRLDHGFVAARKVTRALSECEEGVLGPGAVFAWSRHQLSIARASIVKWLDPPMLQS